jgi:hypothetical protein
MTEFDKLVQLYLSYNCQVVKKSVFRNLLKRVTAARPKSELNKQKKQRILDGISLILSQKGSQVEIDFSEETVNLLTRIAETEEKKTDEVSGVTEPSVKDSFKENIRSYIRVRDGSDKDSSEEELKRIFGKHFNDFEYYSYLDPDGMFLNVLEDSSKIKKTPHIKQRAFYVGNLRRLNRKIKDHHEKEIFHWLYDHDSQAYRLSQKDFENILNEKIFLLEDNEPLGLKNLGNFELSCPNENCSCMNY